jgi:hypothetical protein
MANVKGWKGLKEPAQELGWFKTTGRCIGVQRAMNAPVTVHLWGGEVLKVHRNGSATKLQDQGLLLWAVEQLEVFTVCDVYLAIAVPGQGGTDLFQCDKKIITQIITTLFWALINRDG